MQVDTTCSAVGVHDRKSVNRYSWKVEIVLKNILVTVIKSHMLS